MNYYKNIEVAEKFKVSPASVGRWIKYTKQGKTNLQLCQVNDKEYILKNGHNDAQMELLRKQKAKYKTSSQLIKIQPKPKFYEIFQGETLVDLIHGIEKGELYNKYTYLGQGAKEWKKYVDRTRSENIKNTISNSYEILNTLVHKVKENIQNLKRVNVYEIGPGDAWPVKKFLKELIDEDLINKYIGIDISPQMLDICEDNLNKWFGKKLNVKKYIYDISRSDFQFPLLVDGDESIPNVILFVGSTIENQEEYKDVLYNVRRSMRKEDLLILGITIDNPSSQTYFNFGSKLLTETRPAHKTATLLDLLNIKNDMNKNFYVYNRLYDELNTTRKSELKFTEDVEFHFDNGSLIWKTKKIKGDSIVIWRHKHHNLGEFLKEMEGVGFNVQAFQKSTDEAQAILVCKLA